MALLFCDGFDHYATADGTKKWNVFNAGLSAVGRRSSNAYVMGVNGTLSKILPSSYSTLIVGFAFEYATVNSSNADLIRFNESSTIHTSVRLNTDQSFSVMRGGDGGSVLTTSAAGIILTSGYYYIEFKATIHDTTGAYELRVNGVTVTSGSSADTRNAGTTGLVNTVRVQAPTGGSGTYRIDDLYICDTSGSAPNNTFLGDVRIDTLFPSADGTYSQFTCSTGTSHYALVDETTPNTSDYNESSTAGHKDSYQMGNLTAITGTIYGVQAVGAILKDDAGARSVKVGVRSSSTDSVGSTVALSTSQLYYLNLLETDPATAAAWTESGVNAAEALFEVV